MKCTELVRRLADKKLTRTVVNPEAQNPVVQNIVTASIS